MSRRGNQFGSANARALKGSFASHNSIAPYTFAIWIYVPVTDVVIYLMLYRL